MRGRVMSEAETEIAAMVSGDLCAGAPESALAYFHRCVTIHGRGGDLKLIIPLDLIEWKDGV